MSEFELELLGWIPANCGDAAERATTGALRITAGENLQLPVTEVDDRLGRTVRDHINVPLVSLAEWLLVNWWRLRWEGRPRITTSDWRRAHCVSGIGGDTPWPPLEFSSDGAFIRLEMHAEDTADVAAIRYLRNVIVDVPAGDFERAIDQFVTAIEARLCSLVPEYSDLTELRKELDDERTQPTIAKQCRWQALAGIHPGEATEAWLQHVQVLCDEVGTLGSDEIMGVVPELEEGLQSASLLVDAMKKSSTTVDLSWVQPSPVAGDTAREYPWQTGARLAQQLRITRGLGTEPLANDTLSELLGTPIPLHGDTVSEAALSGGIRNGASVGRTRVLITSRRLESQRFYLGRMIGAAHVLDHNEHLIPVTRSDSALQKLERSFAQELLCPWAALDAFTDEHGLHDEALAEASEHFQVSEWLVRTTLVNRHKLARDRLTGR